MIDFICAHCGALAECSDTGLEWGTMLLCAHCGEYTTVELKALDIAHSADGRKLVVPKSKGESV